MIIQEYLTVCLIEELSEMQHALSKCLRFGPNDKHVTKKTTNLEDAINEFSDVLAIVSLLNHFGVPLNAIEERSKEKVDRTIELMNYSKDLGVISESIEAPPGEQPRHSS